MKFRWEYSANHDQWDMFGPWQNSDGRLDWNSLIVRWAHIDGSADGRCVGFEHSRGQVRHPGILFDNIHEAKAYLEAAVVLSL